MIKAPIIVLVLCFLFIHQVDAKENPIPQEKVEALKKLRSAIRTWAKYCDDGTITNAECPFGDQTLFAGLLCLSGEPSACTGVKNSQSTTGEWFRAPGMVDQDRDNGKPNFSRDQSRGVLAYLIKTKDTEAATRWMDFIKGNDWKLCKKSRVKGNGCSPLFNWWPLTGKAWDYLELPKNKKMRGHNFFIDSLYKPLEAKYQRNDYPLHLTGVYVYLWRETQKSSMKKDPNEKDLEKLTNIIYERAPQNPFFNYIKFGPTEQAVDTVLKYCPQTAPPLVNGKKRGEWIWQRAIDHKHPDTDVLTWNYPGGHDCIFMINLLVGPETQSN